MKIEVEMTEDGGFIVKNAQGKLWVAREYNLLKRIREAFGLPSIGQHNVRPKEEIAPKKAPGIKKTSLKRNED